MNEKYYCSQTGSFSQDFRVKFQKNDLNHHLARIVKNNMLI